MTDASVLEIEGLRFRWPADRTDCLEIAALRVERGEALFLHGPSGCGKSTLLSLMAGVLTAAEGRVALLGQDWRDMRPARRDRRRARHVGYVFQQFNLVPWLSAIDNAVLPCGFSSARAQAAARMAGSPRAQAEALLAAMGLPASACQRAAATLSVGQQQRVAAARALIGGPDLVVADEPTSALDEGNRDDFLALLLDACAASGSALVFVSHDLSLAGRFSRELALPSINRAPRHEAAQA
ncbi:ATP-binding cassette domain-containing protein [Burkholderiaceae bacterium FT117]|uniref:ATP-binding cassette domain-containing protein n=1 Tax=Zeimonas sediminis TaxID=2944268 RepID=UPI002342C923|nr:ATP-binding cassette domain-containing protein [Zeimonas sediminis]MCM5572268.1 ATP-binding cassette domain-containing protein [Zeimonas sediminis]